MSETFGTIPGGFVGADGTQRAASWGSGVSARSAVERGTEVDRADGSVTLFIQADSPGKDKESNWLPAPREPFYMLLRMYLPKIEALNGQYEIPGVENAK